MADDLQRGFGLLLPRAIDEGKQFAPDKVSPEMSAVLIEESVAKEVTTLLCAVCSVDSKLFDQAGGSGSWVMNGFCPGNLNITNIC